MALQFVPRRAPADHHRIAIESATASVRMLLLMDCRSCHRLFAAADIHGKPHAIGRSDRVMFVTNSTSSPGRESSG